MLQSSVLRNKLESETAATADYRRIKRDLLIKNIIESVKHGWTTPSGKKKKLIKEQQIVLEDYFEALMSNQKIKSNVTINAVMRIMLFFASKMNKPFSSINEKDIRKYLMNSKLNNKSPATINSHALNIKRFFNHLGKEELVSWIKISKHNSTLKVSQLLSYDEVKKMIGVASSVRDKLIPIFLLETGARAEEFINIKIGDIKIDGAVMYVELKGKTGQRRVFAKHSLSYFKSLLENHPYRNNPKAPLFIDDVYKKVPTQISTPTLNAILKRLAIRADIDKRVYPHLFRHSRASELAAAGMTEPELRIYFGWRKDSNMPSTYVHLNSDTVFKKLRYIYGIEKEVEEVKKDIFEMKRCSCGHENPPTQLFCTRCNAELISNKINNVKRVLDFGLNNEGTREKLKDLLKEIVREMK